MNPCAFRLSCVLFLASALSLPLAAAPTITSVENAASNNSPGLPNASIAQGAIFIVYGSGLGPANLSVASSAFQSTTLSNTSVAVTVGGSTVKALMYYTSAAQVAALLPSDTPTGTGTVTVSYNNQTSATAPMTVVANNLGIFTIDSSGGGSGIVTYPDYSLVSPVKAANCGGPSTTCGAANPGDTLTLWGTGLGPVSGSDAAGAGLGVNMPNIPLKLWLGGVQAPVTYQGRSGCCVGEDEIVFTVPKDAPTGCAVPLVVQIGNQISNTTLMPVANGSRSCPMIRPDFASFGSEQIEQAVTSGPVNFGIVKLAHFSDGGGAFEDDAKFQFLKLTAFVPGTLPFNASNLDDQPPATCIVYSNLNASFNNWISAASPLDAGSTFSVTGPNGSVNLPVGSGSLTAFNMTGAFLTSGNYTATGTGGADVGPVNAPVTLPAFPKLTSPVNNGSATRANGMTVTWTGGSGSLEIEVNSCTDSSCKNGAAAVCHLPASLGTFNIPAYVMEALPAGSSAGIVLSPYSAAPFTATGLQAGSISTYSNAAGFGYGWGSGGFTLK